MTQHDPQPPFALKNQLCFATYAAGLSFNRAYRAQLDSLGITYPQYLVLLVLWTRDDVTIGEIGEQLGLETNTLTPLLKRLEKLALLTRRRSQQDERKVLIALTPAGLKMRDEVGGIMQCMAEATGMGHDQLRGLISQMQLLRDNLEAAMKDGRLKQPGD